MFLKVENKSLELISEIITASFESKNEKIPALKSARINIKIIKRFIRAAKDLGIIKGEIYLELEADLQEISKMLFRWLEYWLEISENASDLEAFGETSGGSAGCLSDCPDGTG